MKEIFEPEYQPYAPTRVFTRFPSVLATASRGALFAILEFFKVKLRNDNTRRAYLYAAEEFLLYVSRTSPGIELEGILSLHIAAWVDAMEKAGLASPSIKQRLAAVRMLFRALVEGQFLKSSPAAHVRGPKLVVKEGKTPVLSAVEARTLLDSFDAVTLPGLRDRAMVAAMLFTFCRIGALSKLKFEDVIVQEGRIWLRLNEKGGKQMDVPCHPQLMTYLQAYLAALGPIQEERRPLFMTFDRSIIEGQVRWTPSKRPMSQMLSYAMLQRRAKKAGLTTSICNHTFRATGITTFLRCGGSLERAAVIANHESLRTTQLYDRRSREVTVEEIEKIRI